MTEDNMLERPDIAAIRTEVMGSPEAVDAWAFAMQAAHRFARASSCPLGCDVVKWLGERTAALHDAVRDAYLEGK